MGAITPNSSKKATTQITSSEKKMADLCKIPSDRDAFCHYKKSRSSVWYDVAFGEAASSTLYALAFDTDKVQQFNHLQHARRLRNRSIASPGLSEEDRSIAQEEKEQDKLLNEAKNVVKGVGEGYCSEKDADLPLVNEGGNHLWRTKPVKRRGREKADTRRSR